LFLEHFTMTPVGLRRRRLCEESINEVKWVVEDCRQVKRQS
jgi:hypothetical protein